MLTAFFLSIAAINSSTTDGFAVVFSVDVDEKRADISDMSIPGITFDGLIRFLETRKALPPKERAAEHKEDIFIRCLDQLPAKKRTLSKDSKLRDTWSLERSINRGRL